VKTFVSLWGKEKSINPAYRQAGTKDHKVKHKVTQKENISIYYFSGILKIFAIESFSVEGS
jgi:hypothetical protein